MTLPFSFEVSEMKAVPMAGSSALITKGRLETVAAEEATLPVKRMLVQSATGPAAMTLPAAKM